MTMFYYAHLRSGIVMAVTQHPQAIESSDVVPLSGLESELIGKEYRDGQFVDPPTPDPITWHDAGPEYWWIEVGNFYDRFGAAKIPVLASPDPTVQALVRDTQVRKYIDLMRSDVQQFVEFLGTVIPEVTPEVREAVLGPTTDEERYIKGLPQPVEVEE